MRDTSHISIKKDVRTMSYNYKNLNRNKLHCTVVWGIFRLHKSVLKGHLYKEWILFSKVSLIVMKSGVVVNFGCRLLSAGNNFARLYKTPQKTKDHILLRDLLCYSQPKRPHCVVIYGAVLGSDRLLQSWAHFSTAYTCAWPTRHDASVRKP